MTSLFWLGARSGELPLLLVGLLVELAVVW